MIAWLVVLAVLTWVAWKILGPSVRVTWQHRRLLWRALKLRVTEPELYRECKAEMKRDGEWL